MDARGKKFVDATLVRLNGSSGGGKPDTGFGAALRRADNPSMEYQSWEYLAKWCDLENERDRKPFAVIGASLARTKLLSDGSIPLGKAIARCYATDSRDNGQDQAAAKAKLRRILACDSAVEACAVLRPLLNLIGSRGVRLDHGELLAQLLSSDAYFNDWVKPHWAQDFFGRREKE